MFILTEKDVEYCQVTTSESPLEKSHIGINYKGFLFSQVASYQRNQFQRAIVSCRKFLEGENPVTSIIVKNTEHLTIWCENKRLNLMEPQQKQKKAELKSPPVEEITVIKYRGTETIKQAGEQKIDPKNILNRRKKTLKYRGLTY